MTQLLERIRAESIRPALALLPAAMSRNLPQVEVLMLAATRQEAPNREQCQLPVRPGKCGPARGIWQFEEGGGVRGVLRHAATRQAAIDLCHALGVEPTVEGVFAALPKADGDVLDAGFARLLFWTHPRPLPALGDVQGAFEYYLATWRPGAWSRGSKKQRAELREKWAANYAAALAVVLGAK